MSDVRNVYLEPEDRALLRTEDVYQTESESGTIGYSDKLLSVIANYTNSGAPAGFNAQSMVGKSKRGEVALRLFAVVEEPMLGDHRDFSQARFVRAGFKTRGCLAMTACASTICQMIEGKTFEEALRITPQEVKDALDGVPWDKIHTTYFAVEGVHALIGDYVLGQGASLQVLDELAPCDQNDVNCILCEHCSLRDTRINALVDTMVNEGKLEKNKQKSTAAQAAGESGTAAMWIAGAGDAASPTDDANDAAAAQEAKGANDGASQPGSVTANSAEPEGEAAGGTGQEAASALSLDLNNALADVFSDVSAQSNEGELVTPARWTEKGLVPADMTAEDFEMFVYDYLNDHGNDAAADGTAKEAAAENEETSAANMGASSLEGVAAATATSAATVASAATATGAAATAAATAAALTPDGAAAAIAPDDVPDSDGVADGAADGETSAGVNTDGKAKTDSANALRDALPDGYELREIDGELTLVPSQPDAQPVRKKIECASIATLVGEYTYYLYDRSIMTDAYAKWSFLAAEGNDIVTFTDIVREESRIYPRPMPATSLRNAPFNMTDEEIMQTFEQIVESGIAPDIQRTEASNGDIYFFSTDYLSRGYAKSLAEWASVERWMNI